MSDYVFRYKLMSVPEARRDGSSGVMHQIQAEAAPEGTSEWATVPGRNKTIVVPAADLKVVNDMPTGAAKNNAYKQALVNNLNTQPVRISGWDLGSLEALMDANDAAALEATRAHEYLTDTLGLSYPIPFTI